MESMRTLWGRVKYTLLNLLNSLHQQHQATGLPAAIKQLQSRKKAEAPIKEMLGTESEHNRTLEEVVGFCGGSDAVHADNVGNGFDGGKICGWHVILPNTQSINRLYWVSQLYPSTREQVESSRVT